MAYKRKTEDEFQIHGNYGCGWEELAAYKTRKEMREDLKAYRKNSPEGRYKTLKKRVPIEEKA